MENIFRFIPEISMHCWLICKLTRQAVVCYLLLSIFIFFYSFCKSNANGGLALVLPKPVRQKLLGEILCFAVSKKILQNRLVEGICMNNLLARECEML